ncbi:MAG: chemotaxis protein CheW [Clostridiales bacterium]
MQKSDSDAKKNTGLKVNLEPTEEEKKILKQRAFQLAKTPKRDQEEKGKTIEVLSFQLSSEIYGIETSFIQEVLSLKEITPLPLTPPFLKGIMNLRGEIVSVIDIRTFFDLTDSGITDLNRVIYLYSEEMSFGILADKILEVTSIQLSSLHSQGLLTIKGIREEYLKGVSSTGMIILDAAKILTDKRLIINEEL